MTIFDVAQCRLLSQFSNFDVAEIPIYIKYRLSGMGYTEEQAEGIIIAYIESLSAGDNVVAEDIVAALVAEEEIYGVTHLFFSRREFSLWTSVSGEPKTDFLKIFHTEQAVTDASKILYYTPPE